MEQKNRNLRIYEDKAIFEDARSPQCLVMNRNVADGSTEMRMADKQDLGGLSFSDGANIIPMEGIFGIYDLLSGPFVVLILDSEIVFKDEEGLFGGAEFRRAAKLGVLPLFPGGKLLSEDKQADEDRYLALLHRTLQAHQWYFSFTHDVTHTLQRHFKLSPERRRAPLWRRADRRFFWNEAAASGLMAAGAHAWITPVMSAYVDARAGCAVAGTRFTLLFVSRRSRYRQGCRFTKRGIDEAGHVANFVETEQAVLNQDGYLTAHVQIRGSIPVLWASPATLKYAPRVALDRDPARTALAFQKHCDEMLELYGPQGVVFVNLIDRKKDQLRLGTAFEEVATSFRQKLDKPLHYQWFDFHHECRKMRWGNLSKLLDQVGDRFQQQGYFSRAPDGTVISEQKGVVRTNCMDNLDRTNVVQSIFARRSLITQLGQANAPGGTVLESPFKTFEKIFKDVWGNNADAISNLYAGTGALKTDFTRTGKRTKKGLLMDGWNSVKRYYINNFVDGERQDGLDLLLGRHKPDLKTPSPFVLRRGQETLSSFSTKIFVLMIAIFSTLNLVGLQGSTLSSNLFWAMCVTSFIVMATFYQMAKKGGKLGKKLVVLPRLCPENEIVEPAAKMKTA
mmetsp:Transcript_37560/g.58662  ORF Transcript_37560/g.58662 Transcript_37560/m.58662 type:complete len:621 (+) Transcript_37560:148-2010(+)|eukprot:CAMPEP_0206378754 /NCGR_PEP_ID=MMETSP0294-20121207/10927_1 /ASSEMBLY_ACC=CAM_ASM_000327 /TAXON_ID=39354 /ORGANISM="Heterosigma akashiwo, Strain CCMP2393" /LENGTH=620 /DNA_ID=CAMNT_0053827453 /DNA_START=67 /DNA_END=1929 /DNA_ORIENTATION=+